MELELAVDVVMDIGSALRALVAALLEDGG